MKYLKFLKNIFSTVFCPVQRNATFFVFMYVLGILCEVLTLPDGKWDRLYENLWLELFFDLYVVCILLCLLPKRIRGWVSGICSAIAYVVSLVDIYCFTFYDSTINPSILMLVGETDSREAGEFLTTIFSTDVIFSSVGWILLLMFVHVFVANIYRIKKLKLCMQAFAAANDGKLAVCQWSIPVLGLLTAVLAVWSCCASWQNKCAFAQLMSGKTIGEVEHTLTARDHAVLYTPLYRLTFSIYANSLAAQQIETLIEAADKVKVDSCDFKSPTIVLIIGESYSRHHDQQYGYFMETAPRQTRLEKRGYLTKFTDVVTCWNLTSFVFKNVLSMHVVGQKGEWCDYPLFPELFRKAGYHVTFLTNQFLPKAKEAVYDFSGGFFLNNAVLSKEQFDTRNDELYRWDNGLLSCYDEMKKRGEFEHKREYTDSLGNHSVNPNLYIFHLLGQHVTYKTRYPKAQSKFWASSYEEHRPELTDRQRKMLSQYDNACLYNDSIVNEIVRRFDNQEAIVIYMPDHGEECYEGTRGFICRNHSAAIDYDLARYEFEVPFWIYCSPKYIHKHPDVFHRIKVAKDRRFMTDALPHLLVGLAGIHAKDYHAEYDLLSTDYDEKRPRILKGTTDYDKLRDNYYKNVNTGK